MDFRTEITIPKATFTIEPCERMLFVGSCFADNIGKLFVADQFRATVNPYGVMYNPASILHTVARYLHNTPEGEEARTAVFTLGTNHVYILNATGEIVDNCQKRPQRLFTERELSIVECEEYLAEAVRLLRKRRSDVRVILTVSPIRYAKYGFHGSQLSKATLLLAAERLTHRFDCCTYFPAYEIVCDELRDYRFYADDMLHPSTRAVEYIRERFAQTFFSDATETFLREWHPIKAALAHRPFNPDSEAYREFRRQTKAKIVSLAERYPISMDNLEA